MNDFDYVCLFLAIPIGLALTELAQGLSLVFRREGQIQLGWLTPLTVLFMLLIMSMMLENFWSLRDDVTVSMPLILFGFLFTIVFYVAASFVFPERLDTITTLDAWFMKHRKFSLGGTTGLGIGFFLYFLISRSDTFSENPWVFALVSLVFVAIFACPVALAIFAKTERRAFVWLLISNALFLTIIGGFVYRSA